MSDHVGGRQCFFCGVCTVRGWSRRSWKRSIESYLLTEQYLASHQCVRVYANQLFAERQFTDQDRICRTCLLRATRFEVRQREIDEQREFDAAAASVAIDEIFQASSSSSTPHGSASDPLGEVEVSQNVIEEDMPDLPMDDEQVPPQPSPLNSNVNVAALPVSGLTRISSTASLCIVEGCNRTDLHRIPPKIRTSVLKIQSVFIPKGARVCQEHLTSNIWIDLISHCRPTHETFTSAELGAMFKLLQKPDTSYLDFENIDSIDDAIFYFYIGLTKTEFADLLNQSPSVTQTFRRRPNTALAAMLCKLRTGDSNERLSSFFRMTPQHFGSLVRKTQKCLMTDFVPNNLGFDHLYRPDSADRYRDELDERILRIPRILFTDQHNHNQLICVCDGTYFYVQKSSNYGFQRKSYSSHKHRNLIKIFLIVSPDGYIIEVFGPYEANKSDATIMEELINENPDNPFHWFYKPGDVFILDRGFRDVIEKIESVGYKAYMPLTKRENERQLSTQQANDSRKVTLCRWVVETINGRLKNQFRQLRSQCSNYTVPRIAEEVKIACALINVYGKKLTDSDQVDDIVNEIYLKYDTPNLLSDLVIDNNLNHRRARFQPIDGSEGFEQFPILDYDELIVMALGPYQVAQARSYYGEHIKPDGAFLIEVYEDRNIDFDLNDYSIVTNEPWLLRAKIQSRHQSNRVYFVYILIDNGLQGRRKIVEYYCNCLVGKRTLGCCAHVMCIIWYMAWARHQENPIQPPAAFLDVVWAGIENEEENDG